MQQPERIIIYFHGGGYVSGSLRSYACLASRMAEESAAWVLLVDYRLGPENPFPSAYNDCLAVSQAVSTLYNVSSIVLAGDSAGGALAVATMLAILNKTCANPSCCLALISPWLEPCNDSDSMHKNAEYDIIDKAIAMKWIHLYMADQNLHHPSIDFTQADLSGFPPVYIQAASTEILIDQIRFFCSKALASGVKLDLDLFEDLFHAFPVHISFLGFGKDALFRLTSFIKETISHAENS